MEPLPRGFFPAPENKSKGGASVDERLMIFLRKRALAGDVYRSARLPEDKCARLLVLGRCARRAVSPRRLSRFCLGACTVYRDLSIAPFLRIHKPSRVFLAANMLLQIAFRFFASAPVEKESKWFSDLYYKVIVF